MNKEINELVDISQFYGKNKDFVLAGGGNTSYKNKEYMWVKASGEDLACINENGFVKMDREKMKIIGTKTYPTETHEKEKEVLQDLMNSRAEPEKGQRPSVEASLHEVIDYPYVVHLHPALVNGLMCAQEAEEKTFGLFPENSIFIPFAPGYELFKLVSEQLRVYRKKHDKDPHFIFLRNHGIFVGGSTTTEIKQHYDHVIRKIKQHSVDLIDDQNIPVKEKVSKIIPALRMALFQDNAPVLRIRNNELIKPYIVNKKTFKKISLPFIPDMIVYCKGHYLFVENEGTTDDITDPCISAIHRFEQQYGYLPKIIALQDIGIISVAQTASLAELQLNVFEDLIKVSYMSEYFGGPHFMNEEEISFIENWEVEKFRKKRTGISGTFNKTDHKIVIVTGAAQGFGKGIAEQLFEKKMNIVIADLNESKGSALADNLNKRSRKNEALFVQTDVSDIASIQNLIYQTVTFFGGLDIFISNAGILIAGGLEDMTPKNFDLVTKINYNGYFYGVKYASEIMKIQSKYNKDYFMDIIQVNSKSGLKGSNKNFAYAGGKFGGIGLTQSFALELMPYRIKVNSICPGNYFDGPLWSDPDKGLFVQYLNAGKVPGAQTINDVKRYYESMVPAGRGCRVGDVVKAILYAVDQEYETGQAIPVTGGQNMLK